MFMRLSLCVLLASVGTVGAAFAATQTVRNRPQQPVEQAPGAAVAVPGTSYTVDFLALRAQRGAALRSEDLTRAIIRWLSNNFDLPWTDSLPAVKTVSGTKIAVLHYTGLLSDSPEVVARIPAGAMNIVSVYHVPTRTIYLREGWTGGTPEELSALVHELVHHLQAVAQVKYNCGEQREALAYAAQEKWLRLFGHDMLADFGLDRFTIKVLTSCLYN